MHELRNWVEEVGVAFEIVLCWRAVGYVDDCLLHRFRSTGMIHLNLKNTDVATYVLMSSKPPSLIFVMRQKLGF